MRIHRRWSTQTSEQAQRWKPRRSQHRSTQGVRTLLKSIQTGKHSLVIFPPVSVTHIARNSILKLHCRVCVDKSFTGQYAQRNLNRHMERFHSTCAASDDGKHIRCQQPGCTSTFGRPDALLVHLRRSHPELNTPPPKKRKRADMNS
jgi:hypothetical protein